MLLDYITERYGNEFNFDEELLYAVMLKYVQELKKDDSKVYSDKTGFITYKLEGDACIVKDIYTAKTARKTKAAWALFEKVRGISQRTGKNVIIGFSEFGGQNHEDGVQAMKAAGFKEAFKTDTATVFFRGTH